MFSTDAAKNIALGGSAADPVHLGHLGMLRAIVDLRRFDKILWVLNGASLEKPSLAPSNLRLRMAVQAFDEAGLLGSAPSVELVLDEMSSVGLTALRRYRQIRREYPAAREIRLYLGADAVVPQERYNGRCEIAARWSEGERLIQDAQFLIIPRQGYPDPRLLDLPQNFEVFDPVPPVPEASSRVIRACIANGMPWEHWVPECVARVIKTHKLYGWKGGAS